MIDEDLLDYFEVFPWNKNFEIGNKLIDTQHKKLAKLLNELANTLVYEKTIEIEKAFKELAEYANYHFDSEEKVWAKYLKDDELLKEHQKNHASFLPTIIELKNKNTSLIDVVEDIIKFLIRWLSFHIIDEDRRMDIVIRELKKGKSLEEAKKSSDRKMNGSTKVLIETILTMYNGISTRTINLMRERNARIKAEEELTKANKKLHELSITDQLTSLYNRRHFENIFSLELERARRDKSYFSIILFDIDYFKLINDTYGHAYGDKALQDIGKCLKKVCKRATDFIFRVGGEEFAIIFNCAEDDYCLKFVTKVQESINNLNILNEASKISKYMTISIGFISIIPSKTDDRESIMKIVDKRLYIAKENGRNQIVYKDV